MRTQVPFRYFSPLLRALLVLLLSAPAMADDIDIFLTPPSSTNKSNPTVLFVLDNTSNWARQSQQWPGGEQQGQSEVQAISEAIGTLDEKFSIGVMEFGTLGNANQNGGFVTFDVSPMDASNKAALQARLAAIDANINGNTEKRNSGTAYGNLLHDVHQYIAGGDSLFGNAIVHGPIADSRGYTTNYTQFQSPVTGEDDCGDVVIVFVTNPDSSGPTGDTATNTANLVGLGGDATQVRTPGFTTTITETGRDVLLAESACIKDYSGGTQPDRCLTSGNAGLLDVKALCPGPNGTGGDSAYTYCQCTVLDSNCQGGNPKGNTFMVEGVKANITVTPNGTFTAPPKGTGNTYANADEWARYFFQKGVLLPNGSRRFVRTYTIDVFNAQQNAEHTGLMQSTARVGGGKYYEARNQKAILDAIQDIFSDIQSVNSTFTSASLPISATNRSQSENQVFIGMFRPDPKALPRWFGNLKQYKLVIADDGSVQLGDAGGDLVVNPLTGFVSECARSIWTFDTGNYFANAPWINPAPGSLCVGTPNDLYSDSPDGPRVEKGGVSLILRSGNNPPTTSTTPDYVLRRNVKTLSGGSMVNFDVSSSGLPTLTVDFTRGLDVGPVSPDLLEPEYVALSPDTVPQTVEVRPSVHGDIIHSRPQPVNYGGTTGTVVYYGSNDGHFHAVSGNTGKELWSFIAPEFFDRLERLHQNRPSVLFPNPPADDSVLDDDGVARKPKDYFFDGSVGVYQTLNSSAVHIYAAQRRGGRMVYAFNVTNPASPAFLWRAGCPNLADDTGCTTGMTDIGQTWATPAVGLVKGYAGGAKPVVFIAGGYDKCEDENSQTPSCVSAKGRVVYALDGLDGTLLATFSPPVGVTMRSAVADIALVDPDLDGLVDHAYVADLGGNVFRIDLSTPITGEPLAKDSWTMSRIAYTTGAGRKFQFAPTLVQSKNAIYVALGTGDREHPLVTQYSYTQPITNRFYVFVDKFDGILLNLDDTAQMNNVTTGLPQTGCDADSILPAGDKRGWLFDLTDNGRGEQVVTSAAVVGGLVAFSTNRPTPEPVNSCAANLGEARGYLVNLLTGSGAIGGTEDCGLDRSTVFEGGGLPPSPVVTRVVVDGQVRTVAIGVAQKDEGVSSSIEAQRIRPSVNSIRKPTYWLSPQATE